MAKLLGALWLSCENKLSLQKCLYIYNHFEKLKSMPPCGDSQGS